MSLTNILKEGITGNDIITVYHGTSNPEITFNKKYLFTSESKKHASSYGKEIYELEIDISNMISTIDLQDLKKIFDKVGSLYDRYNDEEYYSAEKFYNSIAINDTWEVIEYTDGVVRRLERMADVALITEGGYVNYFIFNTDIIKSKKKIK